jgi:transposase InsO family protein
VVQQTKQRSGWPARRTLRVLEIPPGSFYRWRRQLPPGGSVASRPRSQPGSLYELLPDERQRIVDYALAHPEVRHRELAWKMLDENVVGVSAASVYRVLREANLVCRWQPRSKRNGEARRPLPTRPDEQWQTDLRYVKVGRRNYYLLSFLDVYSRYIVHWALLRWMDGVSVSVEAAAALATLTPQERPLLAAGADESPAAGVAGGSAPRRGPVIQSDHGSGFIAREFAGTLAESEVGHTLIRPHTPTDNAFVERYHRTIGAQIDEHELANDVQARAVIGGIIAHYNHTRLHSSLSFLRPVDFYRGDPAALLAERRRKLQTARALRKQENLKLRQRRLPWAEGESSFTRKGQVSHFVRNISHLPTTRRQPRGQTECGGNGRRARDQRRRGAVRRTADDRGRRSRPPRHRGGGGILAGRAASLGRLNHPHANPSARQPRASGCVETRKLTLLRAPRILRGFAVSSEQD